MTAHPSRVAVMRLFEAHFDRVYRFARRSVDPAAAEELAQDVFIKLLFRTDMDTKQVSVSYLIKIADNMLKRRHRSAERTRRIVEELARRAPGRATDGARDDDGVLTAFDRLSREEQEAVRLIVCEGLSYADAATSLGVRVTTVNNWKHRGIQRLRETVACERAGRAAGASESDPPTRRRAGRRGER